MSRRSQSEKLTTKRTTFAQRTAQALAIDESQAVILLSASRQQSIRINTLQTSTKTALEELKAEGWRGSNYAWMPEGYTAETGSASLRDAMPVTQGHVYIQNAASWLPVLALDPQPSEYVLDICAAPGGKTSHIAAAASNRAHIWANDSSKARLAKLKANCTRLGADIERFTLYDAQYIARRLEGLQFDKILIDAPCSGEGMRNITIDKDMIGWSVAHIKRLAKEQKRIIAQAWQLLKPGGTMVYSTCTMAPEENEAVVDYLLRKNPDARVMPLSLELPNQVPAVRKWSDRQFAAEITNCIRLKPSQHIEAFFVCKLKKVASTN